MFFREKLVICVTLCFYFRSKKGYKVDIKKISSGDNPPHTINVVVEIPAGADPVKYEIDKKSGALFVDRMLRTAMYYPCNYGFIPNTLSLDGDPTDVLVLCEEKLIPGCVIPVRPIGVLLMEDESGKDEKILAVPTPKISPLYAEKQSYKDISASKLDQISHFFSHYKDLEKNKWVKILGWEDAPMAEKLIQEAIDRFED